jgi:hypothetical protein
VLLADALVFIVTYINLKRKIGKKLISRGMDSRSVQFSASCPIWPAVYANIDINRAEATDNFSVVGAMIVCSSNLLQM